jgi:hypothetical protein
MASSGLRSVLVPELEERLAALDRVSSWPEMIADLFADRNRDRV